MTKKSALDALNQLAAEEKEFFKGTFLAPRHSNQPVQVRISGITCTMNVQPRDYEGWGVFRPINRSRCIFEREATRPEKQTYLNLFPSLRLVVCGRLDDQWYGIKALANDARFQITGNVPVALASDIQMFDTILTRYDGNQFWYDGRDTRRSPRFADQLRTCLAEGIDSPEIIGLTPAEKLVYQEALLRRQKAIEEANRDRNEDRLRDALLHAGAIMRSYKDRGDTYTVEYMVGSDRHTSVVDKRDLTVRSAGICLSGGDQNFDLTSLVTVIREGQRRDRIVRVGLREADPYDRTEDREDDDW